MISIYLSVHDTDAAITPGMEIAAEPEDPLIFSACWREKRGLQTQTPVGALSAAYIRSTARLPPVLCLL